MLGLGMEAEVRSLGGRMLVLEAGERRVREAEEREVLKVEAGERRSRSQESSRYSSKSSLPREERRYRDRSSRRDRVVRLEEDDQERIVVLERELKKVQGEIKVKNGFEFKNRGNKEQFKVNLSFKRHLRRMRMMRRD